MLRRAFLAAAAALLLTGGPLAAQDAAPAPSPAPPAHEPKLTDVVLQTQLGNIVIALETERAPVTAGNFLRYVDQGRFNGTVFYRAMKLDWGQQPNGLIQGGTQGDPKRVLPPIAHEAAWQTGVLHTAGAISMARYAPGTATGDFSILLQDLPSMNGRKDGATEEERAGYAAFGHVISGMDVVRAIWAAPVDPAKGEGWMKGQMLAHPVTIIKAYRAPPSP